MSGIDDSKFRNKTLQSDLLRRMCWISVAGFLFCIMPFRIQAGMLSVRVTGGDGQLMPCRIHLTDEAREPIRAPGLPFFRNHFVCPGNVSLTLEKGNYRLEIERGPEFERHDLFVSIDETGTKEIVVTLKQIVDMSALGWHSGDLHVHRNPVEIELLMQAEGLDVAPVITWWNNRNLWLDRDLPTETLHEFGKNHFYDVMAGEDEREGGALLYFHLPEPLQISGSAREYPSPMKFLAEARQHDGVWVDIEKPFWWDVPIWLASGQVDSIGLANNHMCRSTMYESEAWGRPRDVGRLPAPRGNGFWTQEIYYHILNSGLRVPPSAGSASGVLPNPVGYNRVYVQTDAPLDYAEWWEALRAGRSFVTNGPLLICRADGQLPGHVFRASSNSNKPIELEIELMSQDSIAAIEVISNGTVAKRVAVTENPHGFGKYKTQVDIAKGGWFLVRAITDEPRTFRFASTAPYYVEGTDGEKRISRSSVQFFVDWIDERMARVPLKLQDADQQEEVLAHHRRARAFWSELLVDANAD